MGSVLSGARTVMPVIDWSRHTPKEWLENYGAWLDDNPLAKRVSLHVKSPCQILLEMSGAKSKRTPKKVMYGYDMTDTEGFMFMRILKAFEQSADSDMCYVVQRLYVDNLSYSEVARLNQSVWSVHDIRQLEQQGLGWISCALSGAFQFCET